MSPLLLIVLRAVAVLCESSPTRLPDCTLSSRHNRKTADCRGYSLVESPTHLDTDVKVLLLGSNQLTHIVADNFIKYLALQELELDFNRISAIAPHAFRGLSNLRRLDLSRNRLATVPTASWNHLPSIRVLSLQGNPLTYITRGAFLSLTQVEKLELGGCRISRIDHRAFMSLSKLTELDLAGNDLTSLPIASMPRSLSVLRLYGNPWRCDCRLRWLRMWVVGRTTSGKRLNWNFGSNTPKCESPSALRGQTWHNLTLDKFGCAPTIETPGGISDGGEVLLGYGANVTLGCRASGDPRPRTWWVAAAGGVITKAEQDNTRILTLLRLENITTSADYTCFAENTAGRDSLTFAIRIRNPTTQLEHHEPTLNPVYVAIATAAVGTTIIAFAFTVICCAAKSCKDHGKYAVKETVKEGDIGKPLPSTELLEVSETDSGGGEFTMRIFSHTPICADDEPTIEVVDGTSLNTPDLLLDDRHSPYMQHRRAENAYTRTADLKPAIKISSECQNAEVNIEENVCNSIADLKPAIRSDSDTDTERPTHITRPRKPVTFSDDVQIQEIPLLDGHRCASPCRNPICHHRRPLSRSHSANVPPRGVSHVVRQTSVDSISPVHITHLNKSPPHKPPRTYQSSSLDDILAPPFQPSPSKHCNQTDGTSV